MNVNELPIELQKEIPDITPSVPYYLVTVLEEGNQGIMDEVGGRTYFGVDWDLIVDGEHPGIVCETLEVTLH